MYLKWLISGINEYYALERSFVLHVWLHTWRLLHVCVRIPGITTISGLWRDAMYSLVSGSLQTPTDFPGYSSKIPPADKLANPYWGTGCRSAWGGRRRRNAAWLIQYVCHTCRPMTTYLFYRLYVSGTLIQNAIALTSQCNFPHWKERLTIQKLTEKFMQEDNRKEIGNHVFQIPTFPYMLLVVCNQHAWFFPDYFLQVCNHAMLSIFATPHIIKSKKEGDMI